MIKAVKGLGFVALTGAVTSVAAVPGVIDGGGPLSAALAFACMSIVFGCEAFVCFLYAQAYSNERV